MNYWNRRFTVFSIFFAALFLVGFFQSWNVAFAIFNICIISAIMALGVNIQVGYAGIFNAGIMGFAAIGGLAAVLISHPPVTETISIGGFSILLCGLIIGLVVAICILLITRILLSKITRRLLISLTIIIGLFFINFIGSPAVEQIEAFEPAATGFLGGFGMPIIFSWIIGAIAAGFVAWLIGKITLGLRSDYLAIATLGIAETIIYVLKNEDWLTRGVKNVTGIPRPVPYEIELQSSIWFQNLSEYIGIGVIQASSLFVKLCYTSLFLSVLLILLWLCEKALNSPWGRMMRAIRDNETAASAMGKDVTSRHLQIFVIGSAIVGIAGAMLVTLDGQFNPTIYHPLRFTFLIWVMVIVGGSGNNFGAILGGFVVWFFWIEAEIIGNALVQILTLPLSDSSSLKEHFLNTAPQLRLLIMGLVLLLFLRFAPRGVIPEKTLRKLSK